MDPCFEDEFEEDGGDDFGERVLGACLGSAGSVSAPGLLLVRSQGNGLCPWSPSSSVS
jgi:hypothetical protein